jgi:(1->4)-alpha-D-glucan 1-alpha-D-glucosylmutase
MPRLAATYRVQLNKGFTLADARALVPYLERLGISHLYCSPVLRARPGSMHGYDVADPAMVNPELGTEEEWRALAADLHARGMGILLDIVPNHMGIGPSNPYWEDVLAHGERSRWARWFDIDWSAAHGRVVLPVLGAEPDEVIARGELRLELNDVAARLHHHQQSFPIDPATLPDDLQLAKFDTEAVQDPNELVRGEEGHARLRALLDAQHYRLVHWRRAPEEINYRRFFDVNELVALRQEDPEVFEATHALVLRWVRDGVVDGLRIDHVDGLLDPLGYLERLREAVEEARGAPPENHDRANSSADRHHSLAPDTFPILVEKILSPGEQLRADWPVQGTTGYEFLNDLEDVFLDAHGYDDVERCYRRLRRIDGERFEDVARRGKLQILNGPLRADVVRLARLLHPLVHHAHRDWTLPQLADGIARFIAALPVYRTYVDGRTPAPHPHDVAVVERALGELRATDVPAPAREIAELVGDIVLGRAGDQAGGDDAARLGFVQRLQQTSGPATAKGVEDTALYIYVPLASRNEVGGAPDRPLADAVRRFHDANAERRSCWPSTILTTNTHDTKRSADVRARLDVLSEIPEEWHRCLQRWRRLNRKHRTTVRGRLAPDTNTEYLFYQTLVGIFPAPRPGRRADDLPAREWRASARDRLAPYMLKAVKEAKMRTSWTEPDEAFEKALERFIVAVLEPAEEAPFLQDVARLVARIAPAAQINALGRIVLQHTAPGVPDLYRGDELWNFTLVDPDNRRPVDWNRRKALLNASDGEELARDPGSDQAKLALTRRLLQLRREAPPLFLDGEYRALAVRGPRAEHLVAFARATATQRMVVVVPRLLSSSFDSGETSAERTPVSDWGTTFVELPPESHGRSWRSALEHRTVSTEAGDELAVAELFRAQPLAVLLSP